VPSSAKELLSMKSNTRRSFINLGQVTFGDAELTKQNAFQDSKLAIGRAVIDIDWSQL
jgi:hypothetical protein